MSEGKGELKLFEVPVPQSWKESNPSADMATATRSPGMRWIAVNIPSGSEVPEKPLEECEPVRHVKARGGKSGGGAIVGRNVYMTGSDRAIIKVQEGLWEEARGRKVDGGERRKAEVRFKRRAEERKKARQ